MKKIFLIIFLSTAFANIQAQNWEWAIHEKVNKFAVDSIGNVYATCDTTIKRFHSNGTFSWQKQFSGDLLIKGMVADNSGNLFIAGTFTNFSIGANQFISLGSFDIFFCKIDSTGNLLWYKTYGGPYSDYLSDMYISKNQKIYFCGNAGAGAVIGSTTFAVPEFFVTRYHLNGNQELLIKNHYANSWEVSADTSGNIYLLAGQEEGDTVYFGNGSVHMGCCDYGSHFIAKYDASGSIIWVRDLGTVWRNYYEHLDTDNSGNFYLARDRDYQGFELNKFNSVGTKVWTHLIEAIDGSCSSLCVDNNDTIWLAGENMNDFYTSKSFIWKFSPSNSLVGIVPATVSTYGNFIGHDYNNNIYISGTFTDTAIFGTITLLAVAGNRFLAKMKPNLTTVRVSISQTDGTNPTCAGHSVTFTASPVNGGTAPIFQWKVSGTYQGTNSPTYTTSSLTNGQVITCDMTSNLPEAAGSVVTSNAMTIIVNPIPPTPTISQAGATLISSSSSGNQW